MLWLLHGNAWGLGGRSPILSYDAAQVAVAAHELAAHGRLATTFALPLELTRHPQPPWPLAVVQPGLVLAEALLFRLAPREINLGRHNLVQISRPDQREWLALLVPFCCFILIGLVLAIVTSRLLRQRVPQLPEGRRLAAAFAVGMAFYLDPEAQHLAAGGLPELPFTLGLLLAFAALALDVAPRRPLLFGLLLGVTGSLRVDMLWLAPVLAFAGCALAPRGRRARVLLLALAGYALPLAPWWLYKWRMYGSPAWDISRFVVWDGVQGRTWFSIYHLPEAPALPSGAAGLGLLAAKVLRNLPRLLLDVLTGPRALWIGALVVWTLTGWPRRAEVAPACAVPATDTPDPRAPAIAALAVLVTFGIGLLTAAVSIPWLRSMFPARVALEAAGLLALWAVLARAPELASRPLVRRVLYLTAGLLALGWGALQTSRGMAEARAASAERGVPSVLSTLQITVLLTREIPAGEPVMSNLGPMLAWYSGRPVVHLALSPDDVEACRRKLEIRHVALVFRDAEHAWPEWREIVARPLEATKHPEWNIRRVREWQTSDGFKFIWLELGPPKAQLAVGPALALNERTQPMLYLAPDPRVERAIRDGRLSERPPLPAR